MRAVAPAPRQPDRTQRAVGPVRRPTAPEAGTPDARGLLHDEPAGRTSTALPFSSAVAPPGDPLEQDATRAAGRIARGGTASIRAADSASVARAASGPAPALPPGTARAVRSPTGGAPLPRATRQRLEAGFGADLSGVRLHDDAAAHRHAERLRARAFTYGDHIWLSRGASAADLHLLAHETAHVLQHDGLVRRDPDPEAETKEEKPPGVSNKYEVNVELKKVGKHSGSIRFAFQTRSGGVLEGKAETEGKEGFAKGKLFDNKVAYKRAAGKGGHQIAAALATVEAGVKPFEWLSVSLETKFLEGQITFSGDQKLSLAKIGVKVKGTAPESFLTAAGLSAELAKAVTVTIEGKYEYAIPPEDLGALHTMQKAAREKLQSIEEVGKNRAEMERLVQEQQADAKGQKNLAERDKLKKQRRADLDAKRKADKTFGLDEKERKLRELEAKKKELAERNAKDKRKLKDKKRSPRKNKPKRTVSRQNRAEVKQRMKGRRDHMDRLQKEIDDLNRDVRKHKRKHPTPKKSARLKRLDRKLADYDTRLAKRKKKLLDLSSAIKKHEGLIRKADDAIAKAASGMKSKAGKIAGKVLGKQLKKAAGKLLVKLGAKLVPGLNIISTAVDLFEIGRAAYLLATGRATLGLGGGDPSQATKDGVEGGEGGGTEGGATEDPDAGTGATDAGTTGDTATQDADGSGNGDTGTGDTGSPAAGTGETASEDAPDGGTGGGTTDAGTPAPEGGDASAPPVSLHPRTQAVIEAAGEGLVVDGFALQALDDAVPKDIPEAEFQKLLEKIKAQKVGSANELIGRLVVATQPDEPTPTPSPEGADDTVTIEIEPEKTEDKTPTDGTDVSDGTPATDETTTDEETKAPADDRPASETDASEPDASDKDAGTSDTEAADSETTPADGGTTTDEETEGGDGEGGVDGADVEGGEVDAEEGSTAAGGPLVLDQSRALSLLALKKEGETATIVRNEAAITALKAETITATDGTTFSVSTVKVSIGEPDDGIRTLGFEVHLKKTAQGTSKTYKKRATVIEFMSLLYDDAKNKTIPTVDYSALYNALAGLLTVDGDAVTVKSSVKGKTRNLGGIVTAKVMRVVSASKAKEGEYSVNVEIVPTRVVEGKYGPIVNGSLRRFKVGDPVVVPLTLTRK